MFGKQLSFGLFLGHLILTVMKQPALGITISTLRNQKGMTQKELAGACAIDIRTLQRIEAGDVTPRKHTLKLLSETLGCDISIFADNNTSTAIMPREIDHEVPANELKRSFLAGILYAINAVLVVFDLITHSLNSYAHISTILIHTSACIFFCRGFYLIGKRHNNRVMEVSSLLAMILLPLLNAVYLLKQHYIALIVSGVLFTLLCINEIVRAIGFLLEANKKKSQYRMNLYRLYRIAGVVLIVQAMLFLSPNIAIIYVGLLLSLLTNVITTTILYMEYKGRGKMDTLFHLSA